MNCSVILNTYNRPEYTRQALLSLRYQSQPPAEVVISDDGSSDSQLPILQQLAGELNFHLVFVTQEHDGFQLARCRNNGVLTASGDYLVFMDQDLLLTHNYLATHYRHAAPNRFLVPQVVRLTEEQSRCVTPELLQQGQFVSLLTTSQQHKNRRQYQQDRFYSLARVCGYRTHRPKLKGGLFSIFRQDLLRVNGYDEAYRGWGNEDDDLGRRLYAAGIPGRNPFRQDYAVHLHHEPYHNDGERSNRDYYEQRKKRIRAGDSACSVGLVQRRVEDLAITIITTGAR